MAYFNTATSITGTPDAHANTGSAQILFTPGALALPVISFSASTNSGVWYNATGVNPPSVSAGLAISSAGAQRAQFGGTTQTFMGNTLIDGSFGGAAGGSLFTNMGIGTGDIWAHGSAVVGLPSIPTGRVISGNPTTRLGGGLVRASLTKFCDWEDGHLGNTERLHFTASDVMPLAPGRQIWTMNGGGGAARNEPPVTTVGGGIGGPFTFCVSKVIPTGFTIGKNMSIITQGGPAGAVPPIGPLALTGVGANFAVYYYEVGGAGVGAGTWNPPGVDITPVPPQPLQTDTVLQLNHSATPPTSGTGSGSVGGVSTLFISMTFAIPTMGTAPNGILGGYFEIRKQ